MESSIIRWENHSIHSGRYLIGPEVTLFRAGIAPEQEQEGPTVSDRPDGMDSLAQDQALEGIPEEEGQETEID